MKKIVLISCSSKKLPKKSKAKELYSSDLFKKNLEYAISLNPDKTYILSAKYGLLDLEEEIEPYNVTLNKMNKEERENWARNVIKKLKEIVDLENNKIIFLAGHKYREFLIPEIKNYEIPLKGLGIGKQLKFLKSELSKEDDCFIVHKIFNNMDIFTFPFNEIEIPLNGIYVLFEKGENKEDFKRIVRIGTHTGKDQLSSRLRQHFINENKDRSIFRKNIGRAILNKRKDDYIGVWELDFTTKENREKFGHLRDMKKQEEIEKDVTRYIQNNFSFATFEINDKEKRLKTESKIISTVSLCENCKSSKNWLGNFSPKEKIRESGLWLVNELYKEPLSKEDILKMKNLINV